MRTTDWSKTLLGPIETWPQSLRTTVSTCLNSRFPILIWWGPQLIKLYNDAYMPVLGAKHPRALGAPGREVWPEIWHIIGPMLEGVLTRGEATWSEDTLLLLERHGFAEECYFTFSYSPIRDESGGVGGVFTAVTETTAQVLGQRRLRTLEALAAQGSEAETATEACELAVEALRGNPEDVPFALIYLLEGDPREAVLKGQIGLEKACGACPRAVQIDGPEADPVWPFTQVASSGEAVEVDGLAGRFGEIATRGPLTPSRALVLPVTGGSEGRAIGFLVVGLSPRLMLDHSYRGFLGLVAGHIATAISKAQAYEAEKKRAEALAELDRAKTTFFSNISHEFRTPLTLMLGPVEDLLDRGQLPDAERQELELVHRNSLRLLRLVNTLLDFSRIEAGRVQATYEATELAQLTGELASAFRSAVEKAGLRFDVECPPLARAVHVDREMWEKIVLNLISNALKFTFQGEIGVRLREGAAHAILEVSDTGAGIPPAELPHIFDRFHRVEGVRARSQEGSGIGLALVRELVQLHGGRVEVESTLGAGTTFKVLIPFGTAHLPAERLGARRAGTERRTGSAAFVEEALRWLPGDPSAASAEPSGETLAPISGHVLLADDNADMRGYLARILREAGWTVEAVGDGEQALEAIERQRPDLVLADVMMPNLDGFGLLTALRARPETAALPVIMLSARAGNELLSEGLEAGADDYLVKPFSARELVARIATHVQLSRSRQIAEAERQKLYAFFEQAPVGICVFKGPDHVFELANPRYCAMVGRADLVGKRYRDAFPELEGSGLFSVLDEVFRTGEPFVTNEYRADLERGGKHPREAYFSFNLHPIRNQAGEVDRLMAVAIEITESVKARRVAEGARLERERLLQAEQSARRAAEQTSQDNERLLSAARDADRRKDEFLAMLGHELRNPLSPILTALRIMELRGTDSTQRERAVIERQARHLVQLVDDLLDVSRLTRGKVELKLERIEIAEALAQGIEMASPLIEQRGHQLQLAVPRSGLEVHADLTRLAQVFSNLFTNAAKYTDPGGRIAISAVREGPEIVVQVRDSGVGITAEMLPRVFELFAQEHQALDRSQGGLGLGLAIVKNLVELHGGVVEVRSEGRNRGSEFRVRLPAAEAGAAPTLRPFRDERLDGRSEGARPGTAPRVLVVDDNVDTAEMLCEFLSSLGCQAVAAHDGPTALKLARDFEPELALLDIGLPVMDGYELARRLREDWPSERLRLVAVTGYGQESDRKRSRAAGFDAHLVKPLSPEVVAMLVPGMGDRAPNLGSTRI